jgi:hypothetical protein
MAIPRTYTGLVSAIVDLAEDDSSEFSSYIPTAIFLTEEDLIKTLDSDKLVVTTTVTASADDPILARPSTARYIKDVFYTTSAGQKRTVDLKTNDFIQDYWPVTTSTSMYPNGLPKYYGNDGNNNFILGPIPASAYVFTFKNVPQVTHLSAGNTTNFFTDYCADALFYGTMVNMAEFMKDYAVLQVWTSRYQNAVKGLMNEFRRDRRDDGTIPNNPEGEENTLKGKN